MFVGVILLFAIMVGRTKELCVLSPWDTDDARCRYTRVGVIRFLYAQILSRWIVLQRDATRLHIFYDDQYRV